MIEIEFNEAELWFDIWKYSDQSDIIVDIQECIDEQLYAQMWGWA